MTMIGLEAQAPKQQAAENNSGFHLVQCMECVEREESQNF
jgi:hypothetical protein